MFNLCVNRAGTLVVAICLTMLPVLQTASAAIIHTETAIEITERQHQIDRMYLPGLSGFAGGPPGAQS